ncbi:MAG: hypothetical protein ACLFPY_00820 [Desulfonatronovibrio sp.]
MSEATEKFSIEEIKADLFNDMTNLGFMCNGLRKIADSFYDNDDYGNYGIIKAVHDAMWARVDSLESSINMLPGELIKVG